MKGEVLESERKLRIAMPAIAPTGHSLRQYSSQERRNPAIYSVRYFGNKIHLDQNKKLVDQLGVTYVMAGMAGTRQSLLSGLDYWSDL